MAIQILTEHGTELLSPHMVVQNNNTFNSIYERNKFRVQIITQPLFNNRENQMVINAILLMII